MTQIPQIDLSLEVESLKLKLDEGQMKLASKRFFAIQQAYHDNFSALNSDDIEYIDRLKIKIMKDLLVQRF